MMEKITVFTSSDTNRDLHGDYSCFLHCTGSFIDLRNMSQSFHSFLSKRMHGNMTDFHKLNENDWLTLKELILYARNVLEFHVNVKEIPYYCFVHFWENILFKRCNIYNKVLSYTMINDVYSGICKNDFTSFIKSYSSSLQSNENLYKRVITNIYTQIKKCELCTSDIKKYVENFLPITHNNYSYVRKHLDSFSYRKLELNHKCNFLKEESARLINRRITDKVYIDEPIFYSSIFDSSMKEYIETDVAESSLKEIVEMLRFVCYLYSYVFQKLENINSSEQRKLFQITFSLFQLSTIDEMELEVSDKFFQQLRDFSVATITQ